MESLFFSFQIRYKSKFPKIYPYVQGHIFVEIMKMLFQDS